MLWWIAAASAFVLPDQWVYADVYDGTYDLACEAMTLTIDVTVSWSDPTGASSSFVSQGQLAVPCAVTPRERLLVARGIGRRCLASGLPADACREAARQVWDAVGAWESVGADILPIQADVTVLAGDWSSQYLWKAYRAPTAFTWLSGATSATELVLNNHYTAEGDFFAGALTLAGDGVAGEFGAPAVTGGAACLGGAAAWVEGNIDRLAGFSVEASWSVWQGGGCVVSVAGSTVGVGLGLTFDATVSGQRR